MGILAALLATAAAAADGACDVSLVQQTSHGACVYGSTFGCADAGTMFVQSKRGVGAVADALAERVAGLSPRKDSSFLEPTVPR